MNSIAPSKEFTDACKEAEFFETDPWAASRILDFELLTERVLDPCAGRGVLGDALIAKGYDHRKLVEIDLNAWPEQPKRISTGIDFLSETIRDDLYPLCSDWARQEFSVMLNPPFSKTVDFVHQALDLGARKVLMFQRMAFLESSVRAGFFQDMPPNRIWMCGDRATCWRGDLPETDILDDHGEVIVKGRKGRSSPTPHAWFVWERGHNGVMQTGHIYKEK